MAASDGGAYSPLIAAKQMELRAKHMQNLQPLMDVQADLWQAATDRAFREQRSPAGEQWPPLAPSTIASRGGVQSWRKGHRGGGLLRGKAPGGVVLALLKTRRMQRETRYVARPATIEVETVGYMGPHQSGTPDGRPPKRNPLVFDRVEGKPQLVVPFNQGFRDAFIRYVETGVAK